MIEPSAPPPPPPVNQESAPLPPAKKQGKGCFFYGCLTAILLALVILATAGITAWMVKRSLNPKPIEPTVLTTEEQEVFEEKIEIVLESQDDAPASHGSVEAPATDAGTQVLEGEEEEDEDFIRKPLILTERELNSIIGRNTDLADKVYISLRRNRIQFKGNFPVPEDFPFAGGTTIRINVRTRVQLVDGRLELRVENLALGGIPIPGAWIQDIKGKDLLSEAFADDDFVRALSEGVESLEVENGQIVLMLAE